jgi:hypothetical protein
MTRTVFDVQANVGMKQLHFAARPEGAAARRRVIQQLDQADEVHVDFSGVGLVLEPFVDEFLGELLTLLGTAEFRRRIRLIHVDEGLRPLIAAVMQSRR